MRQGVTGRRLASPVPTISDQRHLPSQGTLAQHVVLAALPSQAQAAGMVVREPGDSQWHGPWVVPPQFRHRVQASHSLCAGVATCHFIHSSQTPKICPQPTSPLLEPTVSWASPLGASLPPKLTMTSGELTTTLWAWQSMMVPLAPMLLPNSGPYHPFPLWEHLLLNPLPLLLHRPVCPWTSSPLSPIPASSLASLPCRTARVAFPGGGIQHIPSHRAEQSPSGWQSRQITAWSPQFPTPPGLPLGAPALPLLYFCPFL